MIDRVIYALLQQGAFLFPSQRDLAVLSFLPQNVLGVHHILIGGGDLSLPIICPMGKAGGRTLQRML